MERHGGEKINGQKEIGGQAAPNRASRFSSNPRDVKRYLNVFRYRFYLWNYRRDRRETVCEQEQLCRWIEFTIKWPHVLRWLQRLSPHVEKDTEKASSTVADGLSKLEAVCKEESYEKRLEAYKKLFQSTETGVSWLRDESPIEFIRTESQFDRKSISKCVNKGLY